MAAKHKHKDPAVTLNPHPTLWIMWGKLLMLDKTLQTEQHLDLDGLRSPTRITH